MIKIYSRYRVVLVACFFTLSSCGFDSNNKSTVPSYEGNEAQVSAKNQRANPVCRRICTKIKLKRSVGNMICGVAMPLACTAAIAAVIPGGPAISTATFTLSAGGVVTGFVAGGCYNVFSVRNCSEVFDCAESIYQSQYGRFDTQLNCLKNPPQLG